MERRSKIEALCLNCDKWVRYRTEWCDETEELGGHSVTYRARRAICHGTNPGEPPMRRKTATGRA